jgi:hypothetical protein
LCGKTLEILGFFWAAAPRLLFFALSRAQFVSFHSDKCCAPRHPLRRARLSPSTRLRARRGRRAARSIAIPPPRPRAPLRGTSAGVGKTRYKGIPPLLAPQTRLKSCKSSNGWQRSPLVSALRSSSRVIFRRPRSPSRLPPPHRSLRLATALAAPLPFSCVSLAPGNLM